MLPHCDWESDIGVQHEMEVDCVFDYPLLVSSVVWLRVTGTPVHNTARNWSYCSVALLFILFLFWFWFGFFGGGGLGWGVVGRGGLLLLLLLFLFVCLFFSQDLCTLASRVRAPCSETKSVVCPRTVYERRVVYQEHTHWKHMRSNTFLAFVTLSICSHMLGLHV